MEGESLGERPNTFGLTTSRFFLGILAKMTWKNPGVAFPNNGA